MGPTDKENTAANENEPNLRLRRTRTSSDAKVDRRSYTKPIASDRPFIPTIPRRMTLAIGEEDAIRAERLRTSSFETRQSMILNLMEGQLDVCKTEEALLSRAKPSSPTDQRPICSITYLVLAVAFCQAFSQATNEVLMSRDRGCGDLVFFGEYVFCSIASGPSALSTRRQNGGWQISRPLLIGLSVTSFGYAFLLNMTMATSVPMPVLIILKNGNLVANIIIGSLLFGCRYNAWQVAAVAVVTAGLGITTFAGNSSAPEGDQALNKEAVIGVCLFIGALLLRAFQASLQEVACKNCGGSPASEIIFCRSMLGLPMSLLKSDAIFRTWRRWNESAIGGLVWPSVWGLLCANLFLNLIVKLLMHRLIKQTSALAAALTLTVQRFISFILFAAFLNPNKNETNFGHWIGGAATLVGTFAYSLASFSDGSRCTTDKSS